MNNRKVAILTLVMLISYTSLSASEYLFQIQRSINKPYLGGEFLEADPQVSYEIGSGYEGNIKWEYPFSNTFSFSVGVGASEARYIYKWEHGITRTYHVPYDTISPALIVTKWEAEIKRIHISINIGWRPKGNAISFRFGHNIGYTLNGNQTENWEIVGDLIEGFEPVGIGHSLDCFCGDITDRLQKFPQRGFIEIGYRFQSKYFVIVPNINYTQDYSQLFDSKNSSAYSRARAIQLGVGIGI